MLGFSSEIKQVHGYEPFLRAQLGERVKHDDESPVIVARSSGKILVSRVIDGGLVFARDPESRVYAHGNPGLAVSQNEGTAVVFGDPEESNAMGGNLIIFGKPRKIIIAPGSNVTVVSPSVYTPYKINQFRNSSFTSISPNEMDYAADLDELNLCLDMLFPDDRADLQYVAMKNMLAREPVLQSLKSAA